MSRRVPPSMVELRSVPLLLSLASLTGALALVTPVWAQAAAEPPAAGATMPTPAGQAAPTAQVAPTAQTASEAVPATQAEAPPEAQTPPEPASPAGAGTMALAPPASEPIQPSPSDYDGPPLLFPADKKRKLHVGAYGSLGVAYTRMLHRDGALASVEAAVLLDHRLSIGLAGYGFSRTPRGPDALDGTRREFATGYGGFTLRYAVFAPSFPVYASLGVLVGGGVLGLDTERGWNDDGWDDDDGDDWRRRDQRIEGYFVTQPDITLHANATRWLRFGITGGYRFASGVDAFGYDGTAMSGAVVGANVQLGWF